MIYSELLYEREVWLYLTSLYRIHLFFTQFLSWQLLENQ